MAADVDHLQVGDGGDLATEKAMVQALGFAGVKAVIEGLHELMRGTCASFWRLRARSVLQLSKAGPGPSSISEGRE